MAVRVLGNQDVAPSKGKKKRAIPETKPNIREFFKENPEQENNPYPVVRGKLTDSGWLLIETTEWIGFLHGGSKIATNLLDEILPGLNNKEGFRLVAIPAKGNKFGFVLGVDDEIKSWYAYDTENDSFIISSDKQVAEGKQEQLTLDMFTATKSKSRMSGQPATSETEEKPK